MKISWKQVLASTAGAVLAAVIASLFGVKGTIIGVAIGSMAATIGTTVAAHSIERTRDAVNKVVVRDPTQPSLLRQFGISRLGGTVASAKVAGPVERNPVQSGSETAGVGHEQLDSTVQGPEADEDGERTPLLQRRFRWPVLVGSIVAAFVLALGVVTSIELIAGKPLSTLFGVHNSPKSGTSIGGTISPPPAAPTTTTTTSTTTTSTTTTSTTAPGSTTTTFPGETTTTSGSSSTTSSTSTSVPTNTTTTLGP
jgi:hypothetical protein